jgi:hypothetical protein
VYILCLYSLVLGVQQLPHESGAGCENAIFFKADRPDLEENNISVLDDSKGSEKLFEFDHCFGPQSVMWGWGSGWAWWVAGGVDGHELIKRWEWGCVGMNFAVLS